jgi:serine/threonine protein kinase
MKTVAEEQVVSTPGWWSFFVSPTPYLCTCLVVPLFQFCFEKKYKLFFFNFLYCAKKTLRRTIYETVSLRFARGSVCTSRLFFSREVFMAGLVFGQSGGRVSNFIKMSDVGELYDYGCIDEGTTARIHLWCVASGQIFAAKVLRRKARVSPAESQILSLCAAQGARNIVRLHHATHRVLLLEYCDGGTVATYIYKTPPHPNRINRSREAFRIACDVTCALMDLHFLDCIHRDVKPSNMLQLRRHGRLTAVLADFGEALHATRKLESELYGTPEYLAPELLLRHCLYEYTQAVDVWALGITLFELLFGRRPFDDGLNLTNLTQEQRVAAVRRCLEGSFTVELAELERRRYRAAERGDFAFATVCDAIRECLTWDHHDRPSAASVYETLMGPNVNVPRRRPREE